MEKINDIEAIIPSEIEHYTPLLLALLVSLSLLALLMFWSFWKKRNKRPPHPFDSLDLKRVNKELLYNFTITAKKLEPCDGFEELLEKLEPYKYKRESDPIDPQIIEAIREYIERCKQ